MQDFIQHIVNGISLGSIYALIALGYAMVYGILQMINFAHAEVYMVGAFSVYYSAKLFQFESRPGVASLILCILIAMISSGILAYLIERIAYRPLRQAPKLNVLMTAIGVSLLLQSSGQVIFGADPKVFPEIIKDSVFFNFFGVEIKSLDVAVIVTTLVALLGLRYLIFNTNTGRAMRAVSHNAKTAELLGINVNRTISMTFIIGAALAGIGSVLVGVKYPKIEPLMGMMIGLKAFVAAVFGGIGNLGGAIVGGLVMGLSEEFVVAYISSTYRDALAFGLLIFVLIFKPTGIFGKNTIEKV